MCKCRTPGKKPPELEAMVRFSYDNRDNDCEFYKGLDNPSYSYARPYNEYQELMVKQVSEDDDHVEDLEDVCEARADSNVVEETMAEAEQCDVAINPTSETSEPFMSNNKRESGPESD